MPSSETPTNPSRNGESDASEQRPVAVAEPGPEDLRADGEDSEPGGRDGREPAAFSGRSSSRYVDYDTHELLEKISEYEDERRWQRIREGIWISILAHIVLFSLLSWIPRYVLHSPQVIDPIEAIKKRKDLTYLDELPDALKQIQKPKAKLPPLPKNQSTVDKKTMDALKAMEKARPKPKPPAEQPKAQQPAPPQPAPPLPQPQQPSPLPPTTAAPQPKPEIVQEPQPAPVPAKPNFSVNQPSTADQLRQAMRDSAHGPSGGGLGGGSLHGHSGADGGAQIMSDTQGVDFGPYLQKLIRETYRTWDPLIPEEVNPPISKRGEVEIYFTILPNGRLQAHAMQLTGRSGDVALDRAAWGAIEGADYPPLPKEFHGPNLQLRFRFQYNIR